MNGAVPKLPTFRLLLMIIGSKAFVKEMASRHSLCFGEATVKVRQFVLGMVKTYATHGQRFTPVEAA